MAASGMFLIRDDGQLVEMREHAFNSEDVLQRLLSEYPSLLAGEQINAASPRRWLLIAREVAVPGEEGGTGRWSLDHLFLDQDGIPTLVEVKRSSDTRIRREVVGQLLDYAANAVVYWPVEALRARFEVTCAERGEQPGEVLAAFVAPDAGEDTFWLRVKDHLQAGRVRLVFVADRIPVELQRVVEFLNTQMDPAEVLAVELRQYTGDGVQTLVPRVLGQTAQAQQRKLGGTRETRFWDEQSFLAHLRMRQGIETAQTAEDIIAWARTHFPRIVWGKGKQDGSCARCWFRTESSTGRLHCGAMGGSRFSFSPCARGRPSTVRTCVASS